MQVYTYKIYNYIPFWKRWKVLTIVGIDNIIQVLILG